MLGNIWKVYDLSPWQNHFINGNQIHNRSPWFKPMAILSMEFKSYKQNPWFKPMAIYLLKAQFTLATSKAQFTLATSKAQFTLAISSKAQFSLATSKTQFSLAISKYQFTLALLKAQANYLTLFYQNFKVINTWQNTIS